MTNKPVVQVELTRRFRRDIKRLRSKYRLIQEDVQTIIERLEGGELLGDRVRGVKHPVYQVRLRSSDLTRGKSGGFRVIYFVRTADRVFLITIYAKSERTDIHPDEIRRIIEENVPPTH
jgi:mRNA-degrading endonuclease RelE of RelBE toxin-antitoxin system